MSYTGSPLNLEKIDYNQTGWDTIHNSNLVALNDWAASLESSAALNLGKLTEVDATTFQIEAKASGTYNYVIVAGKKVSISTAKQNDVSAVNTILSDGTDSGSLPSASTEYYAYLSNSDAALSEQLRLCATAPTNGYLATVWRHVGEIKLDGSGNIEYIRDAEAGIVKALLELLTGDRRLAATAIKDLPGLAPRRPNLIWTSATEVVVENNTGTENETKIQFPDGTLRTVVESASAGVGDMRRFLITRNADFSAEENALSGLRNGLSEATNTWYSLYSVGVANSNYFVIVGDTTLPVQASYATLDSAYGANNWVYLGLVCNGDNGGATGDIVKFVQTGPTTLLYGASASAPYNANPRLYSATNTDNPVSYTLAAGTALPAIPANVGSIYVCGYRAETGESTLSFKDGSGTVQSSLITPSVSHISHPPMWVANIAGYTLSHGGSTNSIYKSISLLGFSDKAL